MNQQTIRLILLLLAACGAMSASCTAADDEATSVSWASSLSEGYRRALADHKPLLIRVGAQGCALCRKMELELETPEVQAELARWTPVYLDMDASPTDAEDLGVVFVPALRLHTPGGQQVAEQNGYLGPDDLVAWLKKHYYAVTAAADDVLLDSGEPSASAAVRLVKQLRQRNPVLREAAIRRLLGYPNVAKPAVTKAFWEGGLGTRLAALELLEQWKAPLTDLDPWRPETFTEERRARLEQWGSQDVVGDAIPPKEPKELSEKELADARRQIDRMLHADQAEAEAIRHRLARLGSALLPEVYARLKDVALDQDRRRLLTLRYRLVAPDALVLRWPGGLDRLADTDARQRQQAADELAKLARDDDKPLLLELFADPDPLVREISLRGLQHIGGKEANAALVGLLADPEPNVRAAVLKQLEEAPDVAMAPAVVKYLTQEKDPDLIVHGIRFLQATKGREAAKCLMALLKHESWQVRAEAAAGLGKLHERGHSFSSDTSDAATKLQVDAYVALLDLLDDSDGFVVAKAVEGLADADLVAAVEPLVKAAAQHPDLAPTVLKMLAEKQSMRAKAIPYLGKFCKHEDSRVRAAAITALCLAASDDVADELLAAFDDKESDVRIAAASALFQLLEKRREEAKNKNTTDMHVNVHEIVLDASASPGLTQSIVSKIGELFGSSGAKKPATSEAEAPSDDKQDAKAGDGDQENKGKDEKKGKDKEPADLKAKEDNNPAAKEDKRGMDQWLEECYAGRHRPKWTAQMAAPLEKMLQAEAPKERLAAAMALVPLGKAAAAVPVLLDTLCANPELMDTIHETLPWLEWEQRLKMFQALRGMVSGEEGSAHLISALAETPDRRAAETLWDLLADAKVTTDEVRELQGALMTAYLGQRYYSSSNVSAADRRDLAKAAKPRTTSGNDPQRLVALTLLATAAPEEAAEAAAQLAEDAALSASLRAEAFQVQLVVQQKKEAVQTALASLSGSDAARKKIALSYFVHGPNGLHVLSSGIYLMGDFDNSISVSWSSGTAIVPKAPKGVKLEDVRPLMTDADAEVAACAGYLSVLLGESDGMEPLLRFWRQQKNSYSDWGKLVYQAIAVTDDPKYIPVLREIYPKLQEYEVREFYWTIRPMSGPEILKFRKQIRDEVGASRLQ